MKLATFETPGGEKKLGVVFSERGRILDVAKAQATLTGGGSGNLSSMLALIEAGPDELARVKALLSRGEALNPFLLDLAAVKILAPIPVPPQIRDCSVFAQHVRQGGAGMARLKAKLAGGALPASASREIPEIYHKQPIYYISNRFSVVGPDAVVRWPRYSNVMDFELEIAIVIGKGGKDIPVDRAHEHIFGYALFNDFSARDEQSREMEGWLGPTKGKSFDSGNGLGPWIVTPDELGDSTRLSVSVRVNGEQWAANTTAGMLHSFETIIAFISRDETLYPGEVIASGTVGGCCGLEMDRFLKSGDVIEIEADRIGVLRNKVIVQDARRAEF
ncbi:MAG: fumarylacetoacetate hydrolase family protein [Bradyrhizobiaceae bacterium]|nr:fumarylacetoacetate hydrolase family protein [Bradyrhizobiaceae bacterium]